MIIGAVAVVCDSLFYNDVKEIYKKMHILRIYQLSEEDDEKQKF